MYEPSHLQFFSTLIYLSLIFGSVIISVMGSMIIITFLTRKKIEVKEEILRNRNVGLAMVLGSFIWTIGRMCFESIKPIMNVWYNNYASGFSVKSGFNFVAGILGSLLNALVMGALTVLLAVKVLMVITKDINEWKEIKRGNVAVAIVIAVTVIVVGMFFESTISYIVMNIMNVFDF
ncbi:MAG: DUF350 domain-containing protein [bacterium]|nr:DUF350 domain-containing protein [bacterium]